MSEDRKATMVVVLNIKLAKPVGTSRCPKMLFPKWKQPRKARMRYDLRRSIQDS